MHKLALEPPFFFPGNSMKWFYGVTSFRRYLLSLLTTLNLDRGSDRSFDIYYHNSPMDTYLKHFINTYRCVCWMKSTSIDGLDRPYIRPWLVFYLGIFCIYVSRNPSWYWKNFIVLLHTLSAYDSLLVRYKVDPSDPRESLCARRRYGEAYAYFSIDPATCRENPIKR